MNQISFHFPPLCAWCGRRAPNGLRFVKAERMEGRIRRSMLFKVPVCRECEAYAEALERIQKRFQWGLYIGFGMVMAGVWIWLIFFSGDPISVGDSVLLALEMLVVLLIWVGLIWIVLIWTGLQNLINQRVAGKPPEGYASETWQPCELTGPQRLWFFSQTYQSKFAALNPELTYKKGSLTKSKHHL